jgi:hypothetical protein
LFKTLELLKIHAIIEALRSVGMGLLKREDLEKEGDWAPPENMKRLPGILSSITGLTIVGEAKPHILAQIGFAAADEHISAYYDAGDTSVQKVRDEALRLVGEGRYTSVAADPFLDFILEHQGEEIEPGDVIEHFFVRRVQMRLSLEEAA